MGISVNVNREITIVRDSAEDIAATLRGAGSAFASQVGGNVTLTFTRTTATHSGAVPAGYGNADGLLFDVGVYADGSSAAIRSEYGLTLDQLADLVVDNLDYALDAYDSIEARIQVRRAPVGGSPSDRFENPFEDAEALPEWERELLGDDYDEDYEPEVGTTTNGNVQTAIQAAYDALSGVTVADLLEQDAVNVLVYVGGVSLLKESL